MYMGFQEAENGPKRYEKAPKSKAQVNELFLTKVPHHSVSQSVIS